MPEITAFTDWISDSDVYCTQQRSFFIDIDFLAILYKQFNKRLIIIKMSTMSYIKSWETNWASTTGITYYGFQNANFQEIVAEN